MGACSTVGGKRASGFSKLDSLQRGGRRSNTNGFERELLQSIHFNVCGQLEKVADMPNSSGVRLNRKGDCSAL